MKHSSHLRQLFFQKKSSCLGWGKLCLEVELLLFRLIYITIGRPFDITNYNVNLRIKEMRSFKTCLPCSYSNKMISTKIIFHYWMNYAMKFRKTDWKIFTTIYYYIKIFSYCYHSVNVITVYLCPKVITLSSFQCNKFFDVSTFRTTFHRTKQGRAMITTRIVMT